MIKHQYASDNILQYYEAYIPEVNKRDPNSAKYWVIFIHGGYYRDPKVQAATFQRALASLVSNPLYLHLRTSIAGYASINYRLSAHPDHAQDPEKTPNYEMHNAQHPDHVNDVIAGIAELQRKYGFGSNYLLAGHSVGATLAFQLALCQQKSWQPPSNSNASAEDAIEPPSAILGLNGIYSFPSLHQSFPSYVGMTSGALGPEPKVHASASPASYRSSTYSSSWTPEHGRRRIVILASSPQDTLVDHKQVEVMLEALRGTSSSSEYSPVTRSMSNATAFSDATTINPATASNTLHRVTSSPGFDVQTLQLKGDHDHVWQTGEGLARAIALVVGQMRKDEREVCAGGGDARHFGAA